MKPPQEIPIKLFNEYTLDGNIAVQSYYLNDTASQPRIYTKEMVEQMIEAASARKMNYYGLTDAWLYQALDEYSIKGKNVVVYGSQEPWYESICLSYGAKCTTIEYQEITSMHPGINAITPMQYEQSPTLFDAAISISSFEHDGLGRYGDPLNPNGDIEAMRKTKDALIPGGILYLAVPCATKDILAWNAHRIYGPKRLPLLLQGWELLFVFGKLEEAQMPTGYIQPVFVLRKP
ncbi:DUF268 domain-containing protein [Sporomusa malonica]|uniref:Methyltransferase domain-containing protein n=1 Tax=Sporomusa malonica TaxID=112901 RepID=A0A1W2EMM2_9FIRM|nr:DUF268 domain-containing protein [Sporomusa malonica]SMD10923.1 protein of unknown function, DUF268 [Sporomusa malonica]